MAYMPLKLISIVARLFCYDFSFSHVQTQSYLESVGTGFEKEKQMVSEKNLFFHRITKKIQFSPRH